MNSFTNHGRQLCWITSKYLKVLIIYKLRNRRQKHFKEPNKTRRNIIRKETRQKAYASLPANRPKKTLQLIKENRNCMKPYAIAAAVLHGYLVIHWYRVPNDDVLVCLKPTPLRIVKGGKRTFFNGSNGAIYIDL